MQWVRAYDQNFEILEISLAPETHLMVFSSLWGATCSSRLDHSGSEPFINLIYNFTGGMDM